MPFSFSTYNIPSLLTLYHSHVVLLLYLQYNILNILPLTESTPLYSHISLFAYTMRSLRSLSKNKTTKKVLTMVDLLLLLYGRHWPNCFSSLISFKTFINPLWGVLSIPFTDEETEGQHGSNTFRCFRFQEQYALCVFLFCFFHLCVCTNMCVCKYILYVYVSTCVCVQISMYVLYKYIHTLLLNFIKDYH